MITNNTFFQMLGDVVLKSKAPCGLGCKPTKIQWTPKLLLITEFTNLNWLFTVTLQGINISHLGKRKIIFKMPFLGDMLVAWRVLIGLFDYHLLSFCFGYIFHSMGHFASNHLWYSWDVNARHSQPLLCRFATWICLLKSRSRQCLNLNNNS